MLEILKWVYWALGGLCLMYFAILRLSGRRELDRTWLWPAAGAALLAAGCACLIPLPAWVRFLWRALLCLGAALLAALEGMILLHMRAVPENTPQVLIVLGEKMSGGSAGPALQARIRTAAEYARAHPDVEIIASGGRGTGETASEASVIFDGLIAQGVAPARIRLEERSLRTSENMAFCLKMLGDSAVPVAIVTNGFHVFRALRLARRAGFSRVSALAAPVGGIALPHCMLREAACTIAEFLPRNRPRS